MTFAFSPRNATWLCLDLSITAWIAWRVGPVVDLSVVGLLTGMPFLSLHCDCLTTSWLENAIEGHGPRPMIESQKIHIRRGQ